jgi:hypothetical protein
MTKYTATRDDTGRYFPHQNRHLSLKYRTLPPIVYDTA